MELTLDTFVEYVISVLIVAPLIAAAMMGVTMSLQKRRERKGPAARTKTRRATPLAHPPAEKPH